MFGLKSAYNQIIHARILLQIVKHVVPDLQFFVLLLVKSLHPSSNGPSSSVQFGRKPPQLAPLTRSLEILLSSPARSLFLC